LPVRQEKRKIGEKGGNATSAREEIGKEFVNINRKRTSTGKNQRRQATMPPARAKSTLSKKRACLEVLGKRKKSSRNSREKIEGAPQANKGPKGGSAEKKLTSGYQAWGFGDGKKKTGGS